MHDTCRAEHGDRAIQLTADLPCISQPELFFAEKPKDLREAQALCAGCPVRDDCLDAALIRGEPWGVWGGELLDRGQIITVKRGRGRPRKAAAGA